MTAKANRACTGDHAVAGRHTVDAVLDRVETGRNRTVGGYVAGGVGSTGKSAAAGTAYTGKVAGIGGDCVVGGAVVVDQL